VKKKVIKFMILFLLILIGQQLYSYIGIGGNLDIYVCNVSEIDSVNITLYLDDEKVIHENFGDNPYLSCKNLTFKVSPGKHKLVAIARDGTIRDEYNFYSTLITRVTIELSKDYSNNSNDYNLGFQFFSEWVYKRFVLQ